jgi:hypothetical protein
MLVVVYCKNKRHIEPKDIVKKCDGNVLRAQYIKQRALHAGEGIDAGHFFDEELGCDAERPVCVERYAWVSPGFLERSVHRMMFPDILAAGRSFARMSP